MSMLWPDSQSAYLQVSFRKQKAGYQDQFLLSLPSSLSRLPSMAGLKHWSEVFSKQWVGKLSQVQLQKAGYVVDIGGV